MSSLTIRKATKDDLDLLMASRKEALKAMFGEIPEADLDYMMAHTLEYYKNNVDHVTYFVFDGDTFAACGSICFYQVMPSLHNPTGNKAYIINMYTHHDYRRRGLSNQLLDRLVQEAKERNIKEVHLDATSMGKPVYAKYGFIPSESEMHLPI
ncbi:MAG: GNAT family N-acetyltransferase [Clostridiales bacterium]